MGRLVSACIPFTYLWRFILCWGSLTFCWQDQLFVPFPSFVALQPLIPGSSSAPDTINQTAALHQSSGLPHRAALPAACCWKGARQLDHKGKSLPQVLHNYYPVVDVLVNMGSISSNFYDSQQAFSQGHWYRRNRHNQPQPELWSGSGLWQQWLQGVRVLLAPAQR